MLREARDIAAACGEVDLSMRAVDEMAKTFAVQALTLKLAALTKAAAVKDPEAARATARAYLALVAEAVRADDYESATTAASKGDLAAKAAQDPILPGKFQEYQ